MPLRYSLEGGSDERESDVLRTDALSDLALELHRDHLRISDVVCPAQQLFDKLRTALAHRHGAQRAVAGVAVAAEDHLAGSSEHLAHIAVYDRRIRGDIDAAVLLCRGQTEDVVVLVDGASHRAQTVVAVGQHVRDGETLQPASSRGLYYAHISDVVGCHGIESDLEGAVVRGGVVRRQHAVRHGALERGVPDLGSGHQRTVRETHFFVEYSDHKITSMREIILHARALVKQKFGARTCGAPAPPPADGGRRT